MKDYAYVYVRQYSPDSRQGSIRQQHLSASNDYSLVTSDLSKSSDYTQTHYKLAQSPSTLMEGVLTTDPDTWSDSPVNQPLLDDKYRYSYGRFGTRYGNLDSYSAAIIRTVSYGISNDGYTRTIGFSGQGSIYRLHKDSSGWVTVKKLSLASNDAYIYTYNIFSYCFPPMFSYKNPVNTNVSIRLANFVNTIDPESVSLTLNGESKTVSVTTFIGGLGGVDAIWYNDEYFNYDEQIDVVWSFSDNDSPANNFVIPYWFRTVKDFIGPRISNLSPEDDDSDISVDTCIQFDLRDYESNIDLNSVELYINNVLIVNDDITFTELSTGDGYRILYCPPKNFLYGDEIPVSVYVEDASEENNYLFHVYSFTTESSLPPTVVSTSPVPCRKYKPINVDVEADIVDGGHGLDENSIVLHVDDSVVVFRKLPIIYRED